MTALMLAPVVVTAASLVFGQDLACIGPSPGPIDPPRPERVRCGAALPMAGQTFAGPVLHVVGGRTLCVALGPTPAQWIRVELAGVREPLSRSELTAVAFAKSIVCVAFAVRGDSVVANCALDGAPLGALTQGVTEARFTHPSAAP